MKKPTKADFLLLAILLTAALAALLLPRLQKTESLTAEIYENGHLVQTLVLSSPEAQTVTVGHVTLRATKDGIAFIDSPCPDKRCVRYGMLTRPGETMACVPEGIVVRLRGGAVDGVTG